MIRRLSNTSGPIGCPEADVLSRFVADELDEPQQVVIGRHVDGCESCRDELDKVAESPSFLPTLVGFETEQDSVGEDEFVDRLVRRIQGDIGSFVKRWSSAESDEASGPVLFPGPADDDAPLGRIAEYEVQELIGSGATGHLYKAFDTRLKRVVAIKILRRELAALEDARARFVREAHAAANLQSEFIVGIHEIRTPDDFPPYLVMQFIEGNSLSAYVNGGLNPDAAARSVSQMLAALSVAHGRGIVHRDVKPSNVLVDASTSKLKLVDFGLARLAEQDGQLTSDGVIAGTPAYMSPEQILDPSNVDARTDLYAAGVVLYELLTGERPFRGSVRSLLNDVMHAEPRPIRQLNDRLPRDLETICQKAMSKEVHRRYQTAEEFRADLQRYLRGEPILARPVSGLERLLLWSRRSPIVAGLSAIVCLLLMGGLYGWLSFTLSLADANEQLGTSVSQLKKTNTDLETARARAVEGEQRARMHAEVADQQLNIAFDMISALIFDVQDELGDSPETQGLRRRLLSRAMAGLERVEQSAGGNRIAELSLVMAKSRLADSFRHSGSTDDALEHYREAAALSSELLEAHPRDEQVLRSATLVQWNLGDALREADNIRESHACYQQALQAASTLFELGHSNLAEPLIAIGGQRLLRSSNEPDVLSQCRDIATRLRASLAENSERSNRGRIGSSAYRDGPTRSHKSVSTLGRSKSASERGR